MPWRQPAVRVLSRPSGATALHAACSGNGDRPRRRDDSVLVPMDVGRPRFSGAAARIGSPHPLPGEELWPAHMGAEMDWPVREV
jgi:hypothetical protein